MNATNTSLSGFLRRQCHCYDPRGAFARGLTRIQVNNYMATIQIQTSLRTSRHSFPATAITNTNIRPPALASRSFFSQASSSVAISNLRAHVKPFLLRVHPDVQPDDAKPFNLKAIQNLNSFLDSMENLAIGKKPHPVDKKEFVEIDFIIAVEDHRKGFKKKKNKPPPMNCRRKVQLTWPVEGAEEHPQYLVRHVGQQITKLLRVAGLKVPLELLNNEASSWSSSSEATKAVEDEDPLTREDHFWGDELDLDQAGAQMHKTQEERKDFQSMYQKAAAARRRYTDSIDWKKVQALHKEAYAEVTETLQRQSRTKDIREARLHFIAKILSRVSRDESLTVMDLFVANRRLALLFDHYHERLQLEGSRSLWQVVQIRVGGPRAYNTSPSAMHRRRLRKADNGFSFSYLANGDISFEIPFDFQNDELLQEWERNIYDFNRMKNNEMLDIYKSPESALV